MDRFFGVLVSMSWQGSIAFLVAVGVRFVFEKLHVPKKYMMLVWALPFLCLICPYRFGVADGFWSVSPGEMSVERIAEENVQVTFLESGKLDEENDLGEDGVDVSGADSDLDETAEMTVAKKTGVKRAPEIFQHRLVRNVEEKADGGSTANQAGMSDSDSAHLYASDVYDGIFSAPLDDESWQGDVKPEALERAYADREEEITEQEGEYADVKRVLLLSAEILWGIGAAVLLVLNVISYARLRRRLLCSVLSGDEERVYIGDDVAAPMVFGLCKPKIYLPTGLSEEYAKYVIAHERTHIRRFDSLYKLVVYAVTCVHWMNPLVWFAFHLFGKDMEMTCDEETVRSLGMEERENYAKALLGVASENGAKKRMIFVAPIAFEEGNLKSRIRHLAGFRKGLFVVVAGSVVLSVVLLALLMTKTKEKTVERGQTVAGSEQEQQSIVTDEAQGSGQQENAQDAKRAREIYQNFIARVEDAIRDDFQSESIKTLGISPVFAYGVETRQYTLGYSMSDLDDDGVEELMFVRTGKAETKGEMADSQMIDLYTVKDDELEHVVSATEYNYYYLSIEGAMIHVSTEGTRDSDAYWSSNQRSPLNHHYTNYQAYELYEDGRLHLIEAVLFDVEQAHSQMGSYSPFTNTWSGWYVESGESDVSDSCWYYNDKAVSKKGAVQIDYDQHEQILADYTKMGIDATPFSMVGTIPEEQLSSCGYWDRADVTFADLDGQVFWLGNANNSWCTLLTIFADGTFLGYHYTEQAWDGKYGECHFYGNFANLTKTGDYQYSMKCENVELEGEVGDKKEVDGYGVVTVEPYGFEHADEFILYLPGKDADDLPEAHLGRASGCIEGYMGGYVLGCYCLCNPAPESTAFWVVPRLPMTPETVERGFEPWRGGFYIEE